MRKWVNREIKVIDKPNFWVHLTRGGWEDHQSCHMFISVRDYMFSIGVIRWSMLIDWHVPKNGYSLGIRLQRSLIPFNIRYGVVRTNGYLTVLSQESWWWNKKQS